MCSESFSFSSGPVTFSLAVLTYYEVAQCAYSVLGGYLVSVRQKKGKERRVPSLLSLCLFNTKLARITTWIPILFTDCCDFFGSCFLAFFRNRAFGLWVFINSLLSKSTFFLDSKNSLQLEERSGASEGRIEVSSSIFKAEERREKERPGAGGECPREWIPSHGMDTIRVAAGS